MLKIKKIKIGTLQRSAKCLIEVEHVPNTKLDKVFIGRYENDGRTLRMYFKVHEITEETDCLHQIGYYNANFHKKSIEEIKEIFSLCELIPATDEETKLALQESCLV